MNFSILKLANINKNKYLCWTETKLQVGGTTAYSVRKLFNYLISILYLQLFIKSIISTAGIGTASIGSSTLQYLYDTKTHTIMTSGAASIQLYSVSGLLRKQADGSSMQLEGLTPGIYVVRINGKTTLSVKIKI